MASNDPLTWLDGIADRFEAEWKAGNTPHLEDFLAEAPESHRQLLLRELLAIELHHRRRLGQTPAPDEYQKRFPDLPAAQAAFTTIRSDTLSPPEQPSQDSKSGGAVALVEAGSPRTGNGPAAEGIDSESLPAAPPGFEITGVLGRGGMGVVYQAVDTRLRRIVALKMIRAGSHAERESLTRFRTEAEAVARLQHANIVQIYEVGEHDRCPYLVLEFVAGGSLAEQLHGAPLPSRRAAELALTLARAVQHAHERGVLHRDLKPANVLLTADGTPKITDFGLARSLEGDLRQTGTGVVLGTPSYMAPEQAEGRIRDLGPATDVYGLGALLYELLTGRPPFRGTTAVETLEQVRTHDPVSPTILQPSVPRDLENLCLKCLEKEPRHRYSSAEGLARDLERFLDGEPISARSLTILERVTRALTYSGSPAGSLLRSYSNLLLGMAPFPVLLLLVLFLLFASWPSYPVICLSTSMVAMVVVYPFLLWPMREPLRQVPRGYRRLVWSVMVARGTGLLLVPLVVALMRPGHDLAEFFLVFPLWILLDGNYYLLLGSEGGLSYPVAVVFYAAAVLATLAPSFSPLAWGGMVTISMLTDGLYLRLWNPQE